MVQNNHMHIGFFLQIPPGTGNLLARILSTLYTRQIIISNWSSCPVSSNSVPLCVQTQTQDDPTFYWRSLWHFSVQTRSVMHGTTSLTWLSNHGVILKKCLTQEHSMLAPGWLELGTLWLPDQCLYPLRHTCSNPPPPNTRENINWLNCVWLLLSFSWKVQYKYSLHISRIILMIMMFQKIVSYKIIHRQNGNLCVLINVFHFYFFCCRLHIDFPIAFWKFL